MLKLCPIIYKYEITDINKRVNFQFPTSSKILSFGSQDGKLYVWVLHLMHPDEANRITIFQFLVMATGVENHLFLTEMGESNFDFVGKTHTMYGEVYHLFYRTLP